MKWRALLTGNSARHRVVSTQPSGTHISEIRRATVVRLWMRKVMIAVYLVGLKKVGYPVLAVPILFDRLSPCQRNRGRAEGTPLGWHRRRGLGNRRQALGHLGVDEFLEVLHVVVDHHLDLDRVVLLKNNINSEPGVSAPPVATMA